MPKTTTPRGSHLSPARFGKAAGLTLTIGANTLMALLLLGLGIGMALGPACYLVWAIAVGLLVHEHGLVKPSALSPLNLVFFNMNSYIAVVVLVFTFPSIYF